MRKRVTHVDPERGIFQVTAEDERFYMRPCLNTETGLPDYEWVPSVTYITHYYPRGIGFYKWLAQHGWDEAEAIREAAADKGSKVHQACADLIDGKSVAMDALYLNPSTREPEPLTVDEYECLMAFGEFWRASRPTTLLRDAVVWGEGFAGTLDWLGTLEDPPGLFLIDLKTSQHIFPEHELQVSAYKRAILTGPPESLPESAVNALPMLRLAILQLGVRANKHKKWRLTEVADQYDLFLAAMAIWAKETEGREVFRAEYPLSLTLAHGPKPEPKPAPKPAKKKKRRGANGTVEAPALLEVQ